MAGRRRDRDVNWSPEAEEQLLRRLGEFNLLNSAGTTPNREKFTQWATELSNHFSVPLGWDKVKQKTARLKKTFEAEFLLRTATGLGWDPIEKKPMCTDQYWQQFVTSHPEVERARRKPLPDYDLYFCAFVNSRATGVNEYGQDETRITPPHPPEAIPGSPIDIDGGSQRYNDTGDTSYTEMRHGVSAGGRTPHVASQSRLSNKRSARNSQTRVPNFMERAVDRLVSSIEDHGRKRGKSSATPQSVEKETSQDKCINLLGELDIPQDQYLFMFNYLNAHATLHRPFFTNEGASPLGLDPTDHGATCKSASAASTANLYAWSTVSLSV
ncbi:uncharacterized protein LOC112092196 [Morus notabilis]|uniref:uncharacterized protein LOC112092196 n=1 Tax=Morus notabilis TaxID=981085 RepID=UPI000CED4843|nr:uncharacterized protein LOC112092196 [Morus notabilis]